MSDVLCLLHSRHPRHGLADDKGRDLIFRDHVCYQVASSGFGAYIHASTRAAPYTPRVDKVQHQNRPPFGWKPAQEHYEYLCQERRRADTVHMQGQAHPAQGQ